MSSPGAALAPRAERLPAGRWVVSAEGQFRDEVARDLAAAGYEVAFADPGEVTPDVGEAVGFVAGTDRDSTNLALAAHVRRSRPEVRLCLRRGTSTSAPLLEAFAPETVFVPTDLLARECLARIVTPLTWAFIEHTLRQDDLWSESLLAELVPRCGSASPRTERFTIDPAGAPAAVRWLGRRHLALGDLLRDPDDRDVPAPAFALTLVRDGAPVFLPAPETALEVGDELLVASAPRAYGVLRDVLYNDAAIEYATTGRRVPATWVWRALTRRG